MGKLIKVAFVDFEPDFVPEKSLLYRTLLQKYAVELSKEPEYVFYSNYGEKHLRYDAVRTSHRTSTSATTPSDSTT